MGAVEIACGISVVGDCTITMSHARETIGSKVQVKILFKFFLLIAKAQGKYAHMPILKLHFHTAFLPIDSGTISFTLHGLDDVDDDTKYGDNFRLARVFKRAFDEVEFRFTIEYNTSDRERPFADNQLPAYWRYDPQGVSARLVVADRAERDSIRSLLGGASQAPKEV